jgi:excisionase family DNA binding protein
MQDLSPIGVAELAARLRLPIRWIKAEAKAGRLPHLRVGRRWLFNEAAVRACLHVRASGGEEVWRG